MSGMPNTLSRETILRAFQDLSDELARTGTTGELCLLGGTVMVLAFAARPSTKDVDAIFQPTQTIRAAAQIVAQANGLPPHWLNDAAKGFLSARHETIQAGLPQFPNLRLTMPTPEYLLAMKCMASRIGAVDVVTAYYPKDRVPVKAQYLVEGLFAEGRI